MQKRNGDKMIENEMIKVNILGTIYTIDSKEFGAEDSDGYTDYTSKQILIRKDNYFSVGNFEWLQKCRLRHEIIHAFLHESGLSSNWQHFVDYGHDETVVDWFAIQSQKIFEVFKGLDIL